MTCPANSHLKLTPQLIAEISRYLLVRTEIRKADLCLLFGSHRSAEARVQVTVQLWRDGLVGRVLITGGEYTASGQLEAHEMCEALVAGGVPRHYIILETSATNTGENVAFSLERLKELGLFEAIGSVIAVGSVSASRRYLMTLERHWPEVIKMIAPANKYPVDVADWFAHPEFAAEVLEEWGKVQPYLEAGYLRELNPDTCPLL
ncbi:YdcF family protein [Pseudovibrio sp. Alg231-02]|uniref:YdcF family protein n=1 Tax=Pseudovibrio sp. Alg231-02 TaxID=1922223 RepID=UPI000D554AC9|nr:YdcF family protein [Pseudovibrio sp. Alg231-02]